MQTLAFACRDAFIPRVIKIGIAGVSALAEPLTLSSTATELPSF